MGLVNSKLPYYKIQPSTTAQGRDPEQGGKGTHTDRFSLNILELSLGARVEFQQEHYHGKVTELPN